MLPPHLECVARKYSLGRGEILPTSLLEHVAGNYKVHLLMITDRCPPLIALNRVG